MEIKVFTAFSGYDSQCMALDRLKDNFPNFDYELVGWSEIDKYAEAEWGWFIFPYSWNSCMISEELFPAWSLHRLLCLLYPREDVYLIMPSTAYDDIIDDIENEIKCGGFNQEYLKQ